MIILYSDFDLRIMTNKYGMNLLLWGTEMGTDLFSVLDMIKEVGYDGVEVPILNLDPKHWYQWRTKLDDLGLDRVAETINGPSENAISGDKKIREAALAFNKKVIDCAIVIGADLLIGPYHSGLGAFSGKPATADEMSWAREHLWELSEYADQMGITLGLEYLNRFESYLVSSTDELMSLVKAVDHPSCKMMFDTFHANIEEKDMAKAIMDMGDQLVHVQLSENDRGTLGHGHIDFEKVIDALKAMDYEGMISVEAFSTKLTAANIWRQMFESEEQLTRDSFGYLKGLTK
jgi:D-psicose/D-tagatose/L-ribulose 3-epimerase